MFKIDDFGKMTVIQGDTAIFNVDVENYAFANGDVAYFTVRKDLKDSNIEIKKVITDFVGNSFKVFLDKEDTSIKQGNYVYDIQLNLIDGRVDTVVTPNKFTVLGGVTVD